MRTTLASMAAVWLLAMPATAQVAAERPNATPRFSNLFSDHAVLQRDQPVRLWGHAGAGARLRVELGPQRIDAIADARGRWSVTVPALPAGGPYVLKVTDGQAETVLKDVMVGEVWFCSGQSNMGYKLENATNATNEIRDSANTALRFIDIARDTAVRPLEEAKATSGWALIGPSSAGPASAVCYYMAQALQKQYGVTVGFITSTWGGTQTQAWVGESGLRPLKTFDASLDILSVYADDPKAGETRQAAYLDQWWAAHEPDATNKARWASPAFDDSGWPSAHPDRVWERFGDPALTAFNGAVWYRTSLTLTKAQAQAATSLSLGLVDDSETTFVNGVKVGGGEGRTTRRTYALPKGVLKAGRNLIAVRVLDSGGSGGLYDTDDQRFLTQSDGVKIPLPQIWRYRISADLDALGGVPVTPWEATKGTGSLYNAMVAPATAYTVRGIAWYQGESNVFDPAGFGRLQRALITQWREAFGTPDLPFLIVHLPAYGAVGDAPRASKTAELREAQRQTALSLPKVGLTTIIDLGDRYDIHPAQKSVVGKRLALTARRIAYGEAVPQSPAPQRIERTGDDLIVTFSDAGAGLRTLSSDSAIGFEACDASRLCRYIPAIASGNRVTLSGANRPGTAFVRYAWVESPIVNLFNSDDLPVTPFEMGVE
ncbi:MAG: sialate O-acetylesterase [Asticcacaulis sp.]